MDEAYWDRWNAQYPELVPQLTKDGAGADYVTSSPRVLFVLKEPNAAPGDDMRWLLNSGAKFPIWHTLATWLTGLYGGFPDYANVVHDGVAKSAALRRSAGINLKKLSGGSWTDEAVLHRYAFRDRKLIQEQLRALAPDVVIALGTYEPLLWLLGDDVVNFSPSAHGAELSRGGRIVAWRHPARASGRRHYEAFRDRVATTGILKSFVKQ